jgi:hypothetical protein
MVNVAGRSWNDEREMSPLAPGVQASGSAAAARVRTVVPVKSVRTSLFSFRTSFFSFIGSPRLLSGRGARGGNERRVSLSSRLGYGEHFTTGGGCVE